MNKIIHAKMPTQENFKKYGKIIDLDQPSGTITAGLLDYWPLYSISCKLPNAGILEIRRQENTEITVLERHLLYEELFIPVSGIGIMPFAPASDHDDMDAEPDVAKMEAFVVDGTKAFVVKKGVWHYPARPIGNVIRFLMVVSEECGLDLYNKDITPVSVIL
jgi:ureidoglycolate hydrolase